MIISPAITVPTLKPFQMSYGGLIIGGVESGLPYQLEASPEGLYDIAEITNGDQKRALDQGEFQGVDTFGGRDILLTLIVQSDGVSFDHARQALSGIMKARGSEELPMWFRLPSGLYAVSARPRKYKMAIEVRTVFAEYGIANMMLHCTDPRVYSAPSTGATTELPGKPGGFTFPATFNATFGAITGGIATCNNLGNEEVRPVLVVTGPCKQPRISNASLPGNPTLEFTTELSAGDQLIIDTDWETATLITAGTTEGSSVRNQLVKGSTWWGLEPGESAIQFGSQDPAKTAGSLEVQYASGYSGG